MNGVADPLFPGFRAQSIAISGATIHCVVGGSGPPLLMLHGYPQTHAMWHRIAPRLAERFTVVCSDLRGYGDSSKPDGGVGHVNYSKRAMAADQVEVMRTLGFARFRLAGHDRGGRVAHRLCLDHPHAVERVAVLDISPTRIDVRRHRQGVRDGVLPLVLPDPAVRPARAADRRRSGLLPAQEARRLVVGTPALRSARARRIRALLSRPGDDPRDLRGLSRGSHDRSRARRRGRATARVECPLLALWGTKGVVNRLFDPMADWKGVARDVRGRALPSGHFLAEEAPEETLARTAGVFRGMKPHRSFRCGQWFRRAASGCYNSPLGQVAQLVEQRTENPCVGGSIPPLATNKIRKLGSQPDGPSDFWG